VVSSPVPVLRVERLSTEYRQRGGRVKAVRDVSFSLRRGERIAIVGESGCGKSSLALSVLGLIEPPGEITGGRVWLNDRELDHRDEGQMCAVRGREISLIFQDPMSALDPVKTVGSQVIEAIRAHQPDLGRSALRRRTLELLRDVEIPQAERGLDDYPHEFSGGMRQRVMIAIALANAPDVLIADEPTTALDVTTQAQVIALLNRMVTERNIAVALITHNLGLVAGFTDQVYVMYAGRFVEQAPTDRLFGRPGHPYTRALLQSGTRPDRLLRGPLVAIPGAPPSLADLPLGCSFEARCQVGHGREACRLRTPEAVATSPGAWSECHFTSEVLELGANVGGGEEVHPSEVPNAADPGSGRRIGPLLRVDALRVVYGRRRSWLGRTSDSTTAVDAVSFDVERGETFGLVGESGCGKTTLARAIIGLVQPAGGRVVFDGLDVAEVRGSALRKLRGRMQIVFQDPYSSLDPRMSITQIVEEPLRIHGVDSAVERRRQAREMLDLVGIPSSRGGQRPIEFSGGQRQRIAIARALVLRPELVILDEPISSLDVSIQAQVLNLLRTIQRQVGLTYLFIVHDLAVAEYFCDRLAVLYAGSVMEVGGKETIFKRRAHPYTAALLSAVPIPDPHLERSRQRVLLAGEVTQAALQERGCKFRARCPVGRDRAICEEVRPVLREEGPRHVVACHFPGSLTTGPVSESVRRVEVG
jgi:peptide/nickel transport system ATP-binding protein